MQQAALTCFPQIHSADELVLTELVLENVLAEYEPEEIVALLSAFVFQEKTDTEPTLTTSLDRGIAKIVEISERVNKVQTEYQVILSADDSNDFVSKPRFGMVEVVYEWARGMSFNRITDLTDVMEGTIVRVITRLDETCREVKNAARIIGDPTLFQKMGTCQELIKRYVSFPNAFRRHGHACHVVAVVILRLTRETATSVTVRVCTSRMGVFQTGKQMPVLVNRKCVSEERVEPRLGFWSLRKPPTTPRHLRLCMFMRTWMCSAVPFNWVNSCITVTAFSVDKD